MVIKMFKFQEVHILSEKRLWIFYPFYLLFKTLSVLPNRNSRSRSNHYIQLPAKIEEMPWGKFSQNFVVF